MDKLWLCYTNRLFRNEKTVSCCLVIPYTISLHQKSVKNTIPTSFSMKFLYRRIVRGFLGCIFPPKRNILWPASYFHHPNNTRRSFVHSNTQGIYASGQFRHIDLSCTAAPSGMACYTPELVIDYSIHALPFCYALYL